MKIALKNKDGNEKAGYKKGDFTLHLLLINTEEGVHITTLDGTRVATLSYGVSEFFGEGAPTPLPPEDSFFLSLDVDRENADALDGAHAGIMYNRPEKNN